MRTKINRRARLSTPLYIKKPDGTYDEAPHEIVMQHAWAVVAAHFRVGAPVLTFPKRIKEFIKLEIGRRDHEVFAVILLNSAGRFIDYVELFHGTVDSTVVYPHQVLECVVGYHAAKVILLHNHPSGNCEPSLADLAMTERCKRALALIDVQLVDHLIVGEQVYSFVENGKLTPWL
jgi:DNA repair protein RadC